MGTLKKEPDMKFNKTQLKMGTKVEMEHTNDPKLARRIATHHLEEHPQYYTFLKKMEMKMRKSKKK
jgi:hypothetical protein